MQARYFLTCLWPGLAEIWWRGRLSALPAAIAFGIAVNWLLISTFIYQHWMSGILVRMACWIGVAAWVFYVIRRVRELPGMLFPRDVSDEPDRFPEARVAYLKADWPNAQRLLEKVLAIEPRDPPALLLLAGVYRHIGRLEEARLLLREIGRLEVADPWRLEFVAESNRLDRVMHAESEEISSESPADLTAA